MSFSRHIRSHGSAPSGSRGSLPPIAPYRTALRAGRSPRSFCWALLLLLVVSFGALTEAGHATVVPPLNEDELIESSDLIVTGRAVDGYYTRDDGSLVTVVQVAVDEVFKGTPPQTLWVVLPGGVDASGPVPVVESSPGAPSMRAGEEMVLFLYRPAGHQDHVITGFHQGKLRVANLTSGQRVVFDTTRSRAQAVSPDPPPSAPPPPPSSPGASRPQLHPNVVPYTEYADRLRRLVADQ